MPERNIIRLKNAVFYAYHGAMEDEQSLGGKFEVDLEMVSDLSRAAESDSLRQTIDYEKVYAVIQRIILAKSYRLLEALAGTLANGLLEEFPGLQGITVRIRKPHPPVKGVVDYVEVEISRQR
jgi:dihydroneopterin aldolase